MIVCPVCRAENSSPPNCRRCKADLSMLFSLLSERDHHLERAASAIRSDLAGAAATHLDAADAIRPSPRSGRLRATAELLRGHFRAALEIHARSGGGPNS